MIAAVMIVSVTIRLAAAPLVGFAVVALYGGRQAEHAHRDEDLHHGE